jgi:ubiquinone/menaquinone biosynthesis C-methylase UbiE
MEIHPSHIARYEFAKKYTTGKVVLDDGCADGFGTSLIAQNAEKVVGIDNDPALVARANEEYGKSGNVEFLVGDVRKLPFADNTFDVAVSLEVIEHFTQQEEFLRELNRVVKDGGMVIISTPDHIANGKIGVYQPRHEGHGHPGELTFAQFFHLMNRHFEQIQFYGQFFYSEPSLRDKLKNNIKRMDVLKLRKLIPGSVRSKHNPSVRVYEQDCSIKKLTAPAVQMLSVGINRK